MKVIKKQSKQTYKNKKGIECHYFNYFLVLDNGKQIQIKASFVDDLARLDTIAEYVK